MAISSQVGTATPAYYHLSLNLLTNPISTSIYLVRKTQFKSQELRCRAMERLPAMEDASAMAEKVAKALFLPVPEHQSKFPESRAAKVAIVGVGNVGMACAQTILTQEIAQEIALVDVNPDKLRGEMLDLQHGSAFLPRAQISASTDYSVSKDSDIYIVTAGARQREGESRLSLGERNISLYKSIIPELVRHSPNAILLIISNPVDLLTQISWKVSGFPSNRVIGSGTNLDSSRFRFLIADRLNVNAQNVHAYIVGEHGDSSVPLWSSLTIAGIPVVEFARKVGIPHSQQHLEEIHKAVVNGAYEIIKLKGYTSWAIGYSAASLTKSILTNQRRIHPVSVLAQGFHGIEEEVYLSLPALLGRSGVVSIANSQLSDEERASLQASAKTLWRTQQSFNVYF